MAEHDVDIAIVGAGIAGLWVFHHLKKAGYNTVLVENNAIGGGQTIAAQGIIHSGLKFAFAGQINALAKSISAMPDLWRAALRGEGPVDLSAAKVNAESQYLLIPNGLMGGLVKLVTKKALGGNVRDIPNHEWPNEIQQTGFSGSVVYMDEPVLDVPSVIRALAEPYKDCIVNADIKAKRMIYTAAGSNHVIAREAGQDAGLKTQARPLLMGMIKHAPFPLYAHLVGTSDKPVATITTHEAVDGSLVWYLGAGVAERSKDADPEEVYDATKKAFKKYLPGIDMSRFEWAVLPIDRIEGKSDTQGWMPDTPTIHKAENALYCWPTKLTFAPMLADMVVKNLQESGIKPSSAQTSLNLPSVDYAVAPWDDAKWIKGN